MSGGGGEYGLCVTNVGLVRLYYSRRGQCGGGGECSSSITCVASV